MPATTLGQLQAYLATAGSSNSGNYIEPGSAFIGAMNEIGPRVYAMGYWKDLLTEQVYEGADGYISLDRNTDAVLGAVVNDLPQRVYSSFHDKAMLGNVAFLPDRYGLVDMNYHTLKRDIADLQDVDTEDVTAISTLYLFTTANVAVSNVTIDDGSITVKGRTADGVPVTGVIAGTTTLTIAFPTPVVFIDEIVGSDLPFEIKLLLDNADFESVAAEVLRGYDVVRYRRFRVGGARESTYVHVAVKLAWTTVAASTDVVYLGNLSAWKHALLGKMAEDNADIERAEYHWNVCRKLLDDEVAAARGAAIPKISIDFNSNAGYPIHNHY
jgi:hypothetical protein